MMNTPDGMVRFYIPQHLMPPPGEPLRFRIRKKEPPPQSWWWDDDDDYDELDGRFYDEPDDEFT